MTEYFNDVNILLVDDTPIDIDFLINSLSDLYNLKVALNGQEALDAVSEQIPDLILLDIIMPGMDGWEVCRCLKGNPATAEIPIIFLTALADIEEKTKAFELGAVDYITKPFHPVEVNLRVKTHLSIKSTKDLLSDTNRNLEHIVEQRTMQLQDMQDVTIRMAASLAETRDNETGMHIIRTQKYVETLATNMKIKSGNNSFLNDEMIKLLVKSSALHDIGKIGVPDCILLKPDKLDANEFEEMKKHTIYGERALSQAEKQLKEGQFLQFSREIAVSHHEKWNGSGYPSGLSGKSIPLTGRIMAVADVYDALTSKRIYKPPFSHTKAVEIIREGSGEHFDPSIVDVFLDIQDDFKDIALSHAETPEELSAINN